jgi:putative addiction module CopG family antidote
MTVTLPADLQAFVDEEVAAGAAAEVNEAVAEAVRKLQKKKEYEAKLTALRAEIQLGLDDIAAGRVAPLDVMAILAEVEARADIAEAIRYLRRYSAPAARRLAEQINRKCRVFRNSLPGRLRDDLAPGLRSVVVGDYVFFYLATDTQIIVTRLIHGSRDLPTAYHE